MKRLLGVAVLTALAAGNAAAQRCGIDFYGPCLPDTPAQTAPAKTDTKADAKKVDPMAVTGFDESFFGGQDGLVKAFAFSAAAGKGAGTITAASAPQQDAPAPAPRDAAPQIGAESIVDGDAVADPASYSPGTRIDPVSTAPRSADPQAVTLQKVIAPRSATGRLDWMSVQTQNPPPFALNEETVNHQGTMWDGAAKRRARTDLEEQSRTQNYIRPTE